MVLPEPYLSLSDSWDKHMVLQQTETIWSRIIGE